MLDLRGGKVLQQMLHPAQPDSDAGLSDEDDNPPVRPLRRDPLGVDAREVSNVVRH